MTSLPPVRAGPSRLVLAAVVAGATGVATAGGAGVAVAAEASETSLVRAACPGACPSACVALGGSVRRELASITCAPLVACLAAAPVVPAPPAVALDDATMRPAAAPRAAAILPFAPKTSPPGTR